MFPDAKPRGTLSFEGNETLERHARPTHSSPMCASGQRSLLGETAAASASQG